jgi:hypothetical protein
MLYQVLDLFGIRPDDYDLNIVQENQSLSQVTAGVFTKLDPVIAAEAPDWVLVQGDTTTVMAPARSAGETTLLKILSRITKPTGGCAEIRGRVGSLLKVGTGSQSDHALTGREDIYLKGAIQGVFSNQVFRLRGGEQITVTGDKDRKRQILRFQSLASHQGGRQLNGIVPAQSMILGQLYCTIDHNPVNRKDEKAVSTILEEAAQCSISLLPGDAARRPVLGSQSSSYLCQANLSNKYRVLSKGISDLSNPGAAGLVGVALDQSTGIEIVVGHDFGPRCSKMISLREEPAASVMAARTSSRVTPGMILRRISSLSGRIRPAACNASSVVLGWACT